jgi:hypothetical protein
MLTRKWQILTRPLQCSLAKNILIVNVAMKLHNFCRKYCPGEIFRETMDCDKKLTNLEMNENGGPKDHLDVVRRKGRPPPLTEQQASAANVIAEKISLTERQRLITAALKYCDQPRPKAQCAKSRKRTREALKRRRQEQDQDPDQDHDQDQDSHDSEGWV